MARLDISRIDADKLVIAEVEREVDFLPEYLGDGVKQRVLQIVFGVQEEITAAMDAGEAVPKEKVVINFNDDFSSKVRSRHELASRLLSKGKVQDDNVAVLLKALIHQHVGVSAESVRTVFGFEGDKLREVVNSANVVLAEFNIKVIVKGGVLLLSLAGETNVYVNERIGKALQKEVNRLSTLKGVVANSRRARKVKEKVDAMVNDGPDNLSEEREALNRELRIIIASLKSGVRGDELVNVLIRALNTQFKGAPVGDAFECLVVENQSMRVENERLSGAVAALKARIGEY